MLLRDPQGPHSPRVQAQSYRALLNKSVTGHKRVTKKTAEHMAANVRQGPQCRRRQMPKAVETQRGAGLGGRWKTHQEPGDPDLPGGEETWAETKWRLYWVLGLTNCFGLRFSHKLILHMSVPKEGTQEKYFDFKT